MTPQTYTMGIEFDEPTKARIEGFRKLVERGETVATELRNRLVPSADNKVAALKGKINEADQRGNALAPLVEKAAKHIGTLEALDACEEALQQLIEKVGPTVARAAAGVEAQAERASAKLPHLIAEQVGQWFGSLDLGIPWLQLVADKPSKPTGLAPTRTGSIDPIDDIKLSPASAPAVVPPPMRLALGKFYLDTRGYTWCVYRVDGTEARAVRIDNGYTRIFTTDGRTTQGVQHMVREVTP